MLATCRLESGKKTPPEYASPLIAAQCPYIALERVILHLTNNPSDALLNGFGKVLQIPLCVVGEFTNPTHGGPRAREWSCLRGLA